ncbi:MAG: hypothetical protein ACLTSZ_04845 [Lachnospiraceae bacterium]
MRTKERLEVGYRLNGRYRVCRSLGQGGFGITYLAEDELLGQKIVIRNIFRLALQGGLRMEVSGSQRRRTGLLLQRAGTASCGRRVFLLLFWMCRVS